MYAFEYKNDRKNIDALSEILEAVDKTTTELNRYFESYQTDMAQMKRRNKTINRYKKEVIKSSASVLLTFSLLIGLPFGAHKLAKKLGEGKDKVLIEVSTYEKDKEPTLEKTSRYSIDGPEDKVYIIETIPSKEFNYDLVMTYDATNEKCTKVEDYYNLDLSTLPLISTKNVIEDKENQESKRIVMEKVDYNHIYNDAKSILHLFYAIYIFTIAVLSVVELKSDELSLAINSIRELLDNIKEVCSCESTKELKKKTNAIKEMIMRILNSDKKLLDRFESEFDKNRDLMSDPAELLNKYNELRNKLTEAEYKLAISK